jgi:hypothetical protein
MFTLALIDLSDPIPKGPRAHCDPLSAKARTACKLSWLRQLNPDRNYVTLRASRKLRETSIEASERADRHWVCASRQLGRLMLKAYIIQCM